MHFLAEGGFAHRQRTRSVVSGVIAAVATFLVTAGMAWLLLAVFDRPIAEYPSWWAATATAAAFSAATVAAVFAGRAFTLEALRESRWVESQMSAQAGLVAAWTGESVPTSGSKFIDVWVRNASQLPITDVTLTVLGVPADRRLRDLFDDTPFGEGELPVIPPGEKPLLVPIEVPAPPDPRDTFGDDYDERDSLRVVVNLIFRDSTGLVWHRDSDGTLDWFA